jgi:hypothetical protein
VGVNIRVRVGGHHLQKKRSEKVFITILNTGTAFGYSYAAFIAGTLGCHWAFIMEALAMLPLIAELLRAAPHYPSSSSAPSEILEEIPQDLSPSPISKFTSTTEVNMSHSVSTKSQSFIIDGGTPSTSTTVSSISTSEQPHTPTMRDELIVVLNSPIYLLITAGKSIVNFCIEKIKSSSPFLTFFDILLSLKLSIN